MLLIIQLTNQITYGISWRVSTIFWELYSQPLHMNIMSYFIILTRFKHSLLLCMILMHPQWPDKPTAVPIAMAPASLVSRGESCSHILVSKCCRYVFSPLLHMVSAILHELRPIVKFGENPNKCNLDPSPTSPCPDPHSNPHLGHPGYPEVSIEQSWGVAVTPFLTDHTARSPYQSCHHAWYQ